jgi:UDP-N-acetylmuramate dehydrogenase
VTVDSISDLNLTLKVLGQELVDWTVVGRGTNLLVSDAGYDGAVIVLGREFKRHTIDESGIRAGAGVMLAALVQDSWRAGMSGLQFAAGIPGTFGGALAMNAGANKGWIGEVVRSVTVLVPGEGLRRLQGGEVPWAYRSSGLDRIGVIVEGELGLEAGDPVRIRAEMERFFKFRKESQPLSKPNAGSVFRNPEGDAAGRLIESVGLKGARCGGAMVSPVHANFIVNDGGATASDVAALMSRIREAVMAGYGIELRPEVRFLGRFETA